LSLEFSLNEEMSQALASLLNLDKWLQKASKIHVGSIFGFVILD
jgi:hypothetical protein